MTTVTNTQTTVAASTPKRDMLRLISLLLVAGGILVSGYLSYVKLTQTSIQCAGGEAFNCDAVQSSVYGQIAGVPIAYLGLLSYLVLGGLLLLENRVGLLQSYGIVLVFGITLFGFIYSMFLVYVQAAILRSYCSWCLVHEIIMTLLFVVSGMRLFRSMRD